MTLLATYNLEAGYDKPLLPPLNVTVESGETVALLGHNGIGKSTLFKTLTGEIPALAGHVEIYGKKLKNYSRRELATKTAIVTTDRISAGGLRVEEIVALGRQPHTGLFGHLGESDRKAVAEAMNDVGIIHKRNEYFSRLSDGERQKTMIARALAQEAPLIILDEPFSFLDTASRIEILSLLNRLASDNDIGVLFSSHDVAQAIRMASKIWLCTADGDFHADTPQQIVANKYIDRMFNNKNVRFDSTQNDFVQKEK